MNREEFRTTSIALLRTAVGWQTKIAKILGVADRTVRRWIKTGSAPAWATIKLEELTGLADPVRVLPRDEWAVGDGAPGINGHRREYIMHLTPPVFIARLVAMDEHGRPLTKERPVNLESGELYQIGDTLLCEIVWLDRPKVDEITALFEAACEFVDEAYSF
ncbi:MAG: hypothetical protein PHX05_08285 [Acidobacteriota bacterium]|nr:hypothetical protein [Acidobacteriota bacterium]